MRKIRAYLLSDWRRLLWLSACLAGVSGLLLYKLGSLTGGLSAAEHAASTAIVGWQGIYNNSLYLPLKLVRSAVFFGFPDHGQTLTRLPNALFGGLAIVAYTWLIRLWHGPRTAWLAGVLFATSAWVLHASRLASFDVLYLWAIPTLLLVYLELKRHPRNKWLWYGSLLLTGLMLYIPGMVWLIIANIYMQRDALRSSWRQFSRLGQRLLYVLAGMVWLPLLVIDLTRPGHLIQWLGLPADFPAILTLLKQFVAVPVHLFVRGPQYPEIWLGKLPVLDAFTLAACIIGIYFYAKNHRTARSRLLACFFVVGLVLVGLGGAVELSLLVPLLYIAAATGIAYLQHNWLRVFPLNPVARSLGLGLLTLAVGLSCVYNLRSYFVAWPHNQVTRSTFQYHR